MAIFKCKMCGGNLEASDGMSVCECEYCGTNQTLPTGNNEATDNLFNRANNLRLKGDFDKAAQIYEKIVQTNSTESEAYWGLVLCKYGIEYVEDPATFNRVPTCHRTSYEAVTADADYLSAIKNADSLQRRIYESEARAIDEIQKNILNIVKNEEPFDVFICYKQTDASGNRTIDSALANDIYHQLTQEGLKVFYAAITLEDKLGREYEPYIFAALNSAKVMLVIGTKPENFEAVWVKNEWSRFLKLIRNDRSKLLIPCYKDMDAYDLPEEFAHLQAQDMSKIGFINDIVRGIKKVVSSPEASTPESKPETVVINHNVGSTEVLLKRALMSLEDGEWQKADEFCEQALNINPEYAMAYVGKLMAELHVNEQDKLGECEKPFDNNNNYKKAIRCADENLKNVLTDYIRTINDRIENDRINNIYASATQKMKSAVNEEKYLAAAKDFETISEFRNSKELARECREKAEFIRKETIYKNACIVLDSSHNWVGKRTDMKAYEDAISLFKSLQGWKDSDSKIIECQKRIEELKAEAKKDESNTILQAEFLGIEEYRKHTNAKNLIKRIIKTSIITLAITIISFFIIIFLIDNFDHFENNYKKEQSTHEKNRNNSWNDIIAIASGDVCTIGLKSDGSVVATGIDIYGENNVDEWDDIIAIAAGNSHTIGLKSDGTVIATGKNDHGQCDVNEWHDIVAVSAGSWHTVGVKSDGTVIAAGDNLYGECDVSEWNDIVAVSAGIGFSLGLKSDGTVVSTVRWCNVSDWHDIIAVSAGVFHAIGLKSDGTVVATGENDYGRCDVSGWTDIISISAGSYHTIGLKSDGTVVATGDNEHGECNVSGWTDIVAVSAGTFNTVGLKSDGTVIGTDGTEYK